MSIETGKMSEDALRNVRVQEANGARVKRLESAEQAKVMEAKVKAEAEKSARLAEDLDHRRFASVKSDQPRIVEASRLAHKLAKPIDTSVRDFSAPQAESGDVKQTDDGDDWVTMAKASVSNKRPTPTKPKKFFGLFG